MGINPADFRQYVLRPTLNTLGQWSPSLENLLLGTAAQASQLGSVLVGDHGLGVYQISHEQHQRVWDTYFAFDPDLASTVRGLASQREFLIDPDRELAGNLNYATAIAWGVYAQHHAAIPTNPDDLTALALCWCQYFNENPLEHPDTFLQHYPEPDCAPQKIRAA